MDGAVDQLWSLAVDRPFVDANALAGAVESAVGDVSSLDYRSRLLVRDAVGALRSHWGDQRFDQWLSRSPARQSIERAADPDYFEKDSDEIGFPSLERRIVDAIEPESIHRFFRELSLRVSQSTQIVIGGSIPLILAGALARGTEDIDVVDDVPAVIREQHELLNELADLHGLRLTQFQSQYLPAGWNRRLWSVGTFGNLQVFSVDPYDIFVGKLFSARRKDRADLNALVSHLGKQKLTDRFRESTAALRAEPKLLESATKNWYVLFGEELPS
jgi:hypothetical protein